MQPVVINFCPLSRDNVSITWQPQFTIPWNYVTWPCTWDRRLLHSQKSFVWFQEYTHLKICAKLIFAASCEPSTDW